MVLLTFFLRGTFQVVSVEKRYQGGCLFLTLILESLDCIFYILA